MNQDDLERRLWEILQAETTGCAWREIRLAEEGCQRLPAHKEQITNVIANWRNRGLVETTHADARVIVTEKGRETDDL